jgi:protein-S-isoprenylcysteine O-methyltransferase Ste14
LLAFEALAIGAITIVALAFDLILMPAAAPVLRLGPMWLVGEVVALAAGLVPGLLLARMTMRDERLPERAVLQVIAFSGLTLFVLPAIVAEATGAFWIQAFERPVWQLSLIAQGLAIPAIIGLSAVQEFVIRGGGTPVPYDAPKRLVTTGIYAYVRNPMQLSAVLLLCLLGLAFQNVWLAGAGIMAHIYSAGLAGWDEDDDLNKRFGSAWTTYRRGVRTWWPRVRPWHRDNRPDQLYIAESCGMCSEVACWFRRHGARGLEIVPAEHHPLRALTRITYESSDGVYTASGIEAVARALEHVHIGWALIACVLRLPVVRPLTQIIVDASGGGPRRMAQRGALGRL